MNTRTWIVFSALAAFVPNSGVVAQDNFASSVAFLEALYHATDGDHWHSNDGWLDENVHWCDWHGVECTEESGQFVLESLRLPQNHLVGTLPESWGEFIEQGLLPQDLLDLGGNSISGTLPALPVLTRQVFIWGNQLSGSLPVLDLPEAPWVVEAVSLPNNQFTGTIPESWSQLRLSWLRLNENRLQGGAENAFAAMTSDPDHFGAHLSLAGNQFDEILTEAITEANLFAADGFFPSFGGINLCWNRFEFENESVSDWIALRHAAGPNFQQCLNRDRLGIDPAISGSWYQPERDGKGIVLHQLDHGPSLLYSFSFDSQGNQQWMISSSTGDWTHYIGASLVETRGGFGQGFDLDDQGRPLTRQGMSLRLDRTGPESLHVERTLWDFRGMPIPDPGPFLPSPIDMWQERYDLEQLTRLAGTTCDNKIWFQQFSGSWYDPGRNGEGFVVEALENGRGVVYWFTYAPDDSGRQAWMMGDGEFLSSGIGTPPPGMPVARLVVDLLQQPVGGVIGPGFDPADVERIDWGSLVIDFYRNDTADVFWDSDLEEFGAGETALQRLARPMLAECE